MITSDDDVDDADDIRRRHQAEIIIAADSDRLASIQRLILIGEI